MKWFQAKEKSAGKNRLVLTWYIYRFFGKKALSLLAFFVAFFTFLFSKETRFYSKKYLTIVSKYTKIKPSVINQIKHINSYAQSLADKIVMYSGEFNPEKIIFENEEDKNELYNDISKKHGVCFLFSHVGNIEVLQAFFQNQKVFPNLGVNIFLSKNQTKIFNDFIETIKKPIPAKYIITEDFDAAGIMKLKDNLDNGEVLFIAGDRLSQNNAEKSVTQTMLGYTVNLPKGTFRLAKLLEVPVYFIAAIKIQKGYMIYTKKLNVENLSQEYIKNMEGITIKNPFQFYHFYDFFND